jgi:hypothetical protein
VDRDQLVRLDATSPAIEARESEGDAGLLPLLLHLLSAVDALLQVTLEVRDLGARDERGQLSADLQEVNVDVLLLLWVLGQSSQLKKLLLC